MLGPRVPPACLRQVPRRTILDTAQRFANKASQISSAMTQISKATTLSTNDQLQEDFRARDSFKQSRPALTLLRLTFKHLLLEVYQGRRSCPMLREGVGLAVPLPAPRTSRS